jgi:glycosyltransferase involved in cell wall biosynthesis
MWGIPVVSHFRINVPDFLRQWHKDLRFRALSALIGLSQVNIVQNEASLACVATLVRAGNRHPVLLPNFIGDDVFVHHKAGQKTLHERLRVLFVGWVNRFKGCGEIFAVARQLPEVYFILIGPMMPDIQDCLQTLPPNVTLYGAMDNAAVLREMCASDVFLFPSHSEGFPNVVLEAMAIGLPIIATRVGAIPEMVEEGKGGFLVERADVHGIVQALRLLMKDASLRACMGQFNRKKSQAQYAYSAVIARLTALYDMVTLRVMRTGLTKDTVRSLVTSYDMHLTNQI